MSSGATALHRGERLRAVLRGRPLGTEGRQLALVWGLLAASALALRPVWIALAPLAPACPFRAITGVPCLSCGTTRSAIALLDARVLDALPLNPLAAVAGIVFLLGGVVAPLWAALHLPVPALRVRPTRVLRAALVAALLANWAWLIAMKT